MEVKTRKERGEKKRRNSCSTSLYERVYELLKIKIMICLNNKNMRLQAPEKEEVLHSMDSSLFSRLQGTLVRGCYERLQTGNFGR